MKFALVGVGGAGSRVVDQILDIEKSTGRDFSRGNAIVFTTDASEIDSINHIGKDYRYLVGDTDPSVNGNGVKGDPDLAVTVARSDIEEIRRAFDSVDLLDMDAILVIAGLGGGTGAGAGAVLVNELKRIYEKPVYVLGILPSKNEGKQCSRNAARSLRTVVPEADNVLLFDNATWTPEDTNIEDAYQRLNRELALRTVSLFAGGEFDSKDLAENKLDPSDIMRTLDTGGVSTIGFASIGASVSKRGLLSRILGLGGEDEQPTDAAKVKWLVRNAATSRLTLPCDIESAERALVVLSGPPSALSRKGFEEARYWLGQVTDTVDVLAGDEPINGASELSAVVVLSNVTEVPRIDELQKIGKQDLAETNSSS